MDFVESGLKGVGLLWILWVSAKWLLRMRRASIEKRELLEFWARHDDGPWGSA